MKIRAKLSLFAGSLVLLTTGALAYLDFVHQRRLIEHGLAADRAGQSARFAALCAQALTINNELLMLNYAKLLRASPGISYAYFVDTQGTILVHTDGRFLYRPLSEWRRTSRTLQMSEPVATGRHRVGDAVIGFSEEYHAGLLKQALEGSLRQVAAASLGVAVLGLGAAILLTHLLTYPLRRLARGSEEIAKGHFNTSVEAESRDELGDLGRRFNAMARSLAVLDEVKDEFIASVSHDLRNPLSAVQMYADYLLHEDENKDKLLPTQRDLIRTIMDNAKRLVLFVNNVLDTAKIRAGRMEYFPRAVALETVVERVRKLLGIMAAERGIHVTAEIPLDLPELWVDPERLDQVLANLFSNAVKFTPPGGKITLGGRGAGDRVEIYVADTGKGIDKAQMPRLFERFSQFSVSEQRDKGIKGTGLGLSIVKKTVDDMGGSVSVESQAGKGTRFTLAFPKAPIQARSPGKVQAKADIPAPAGAKVLVIDDEPSFGQFARLLLEPAGYRASFALGGERGLAAAVSERPDIILLDLGMPGLGGAEVLLKLKSNPATERIPVILCSISQGAEEIDQARRAGAADFLPKPLNPDQLRLRVGRALAAAREGKAA